MSQIERILIPTDFSENSARALAYAIELAKIHDAEVTVLHVIEPPVYAVGGAVPGFTLPNLENEVRDFAERRLKELNEQVIEGQVKAELEVADGAPFVEIVRAAKRLDSSLIVLATHGRRGLSHVLLGSVAEKVVRKAPCPVLTFREGITEFEMP